MKNNRGFAPIALLIIIGVLAIAGGAYYVGKQSGQAPIAENPDGLSTTPTSTPIAGWKIYVDDTHGFSFEYPEKLTLSASGGATILSHTIPFENRDGGCDMRGDSALSKTLNDFVVSISVVPGTVNPPYKVDGSYSSGALSGVWSYMGAEGCGQTSYYFPFPGGKTLVVTRSEVQILSNNVTPEVRAKVLAVPGVITYEESKSILDQVLSTFKFVAADTVNKEYKKIISLNFDYGSGENQFGVLREAGGVGPGSFATDNGNNLYITDTRNSRVKVFNSLGQPVLVLGADSPKEVAVDGNGNIYTYAWGSGNPGQIFYKYDPRGKLLGKLENPIQKAGLGRLYVSDNTLYASDMEENSYLISSITGEFKHFPPSVVPGVFGQSGKRYYARRSVAGIGFVDVVGLTDAGKKTIEIKKNGLSTIRFLGEDQKENIYIQTESLSSKNKVILEVLKYGPSGNLITTIDVSGGTYSFPSAKLLDVSPAGDIWQVIPGTDKLQVNRWSIEE